MSNIYYTYSACSELVCFPQMVHKAFSVIDTVLCLDFFPAVDRLKTAVFKTATTKTIAAKVHALSDVISESVGMFSDVYWFIGEFKSFKILPQTTFNWAKPIYNKIAFLQYLGTSSSVYQSFKIFVFMHQFNATFQNRLPQASNEKCGLERSCMCLIKNYEMLEKSFTISSDIKGQVSKIMTQQSYLDASLQLQKLRQKILRACLLDVCSTANTVFYYSLYILKCIVIKNRFITLLILGTCISSLAFSILSLQQIVQP